MSGSADFAYQAAQIMGGKLPGSETSKVPDSEGAAHWTAVSGWKAVGYHCLENGSRFYLGYVVEEAWQLARLNQILEGREEL